ncbi:CCA tRNA nucleotidyltransferase [Beijerinckia indica]|uniref:Polynucleotide adenylyltransferase region n=1 Tax=Beijerinckia indica subsp. indica (strain ATCC 9039 / DSM 1715 / NCIMB 8712) TaxID=395963 RepID=B2IKD5_BEII9|nr:CCA tRNA nucleotidyltransferase [Beijerinckia indica]ACB96415.1 Polynucleotide adenylyltransferase region [Beijerinckia indica subsp. indica ATCC 9039]
MPIHTTTRPETTALLAHKGVERIFAIFNGAGEETRIVGGSVRNALAGQHVHEFDFATTALPEIIQARAEAAGLKYIPTGIEHGTITILAGGESFEITTLRKDVETDGRRAIVRFGRDFEEDAHRRDFTINALSMDQHGTLYDYTGGLADLAAGRVRFIGAARQRIREDYLRILRLFRFSADFAGGRLDAEGLDAAIREREGLRRLSTERIRAELLKLMGGKRVAEVAYEIAEAGLFTPLLPLVPQPSRLNRFITIETEATQDPLLRLAALFTMVRENVTALRVHLSLSNAETTRLDHAVTLASSLHALAEPPSEPAMRALLLHRSHQTLDDAFVLTQAGAPAALGAAWASARARLRTLPKPKLPFSGADLIARGISPGPGMGEALQRLEKAWIAAGFPEDSESLAALLDRIAPARRV